ncbi:CBS domain-containing protein [Natronomonas sp.]|uniref:CBS domain-containing protein n=1 Tax=Natronomonas sp. TaxID=2184060 RepID=UPI00286FED43|nr:CBS domain-containing protein [Natronomonas sp.]
MIDRHIADLKPEFAPTVRPETPVSDVSEALCDPDVSAVVVEENESIAGIVTASDVVAMVTVTETEHHPTARAIMSSPAVTVSPDATLVEAAERMRTAGVGHLVVEGETYRGVVSTATLAPFLSRHRLDVEWRGEPSVFTASRDNRLVVKN